MLQTLVLSEHQSRRGIPLLHNTSQAKVKNIITKLLTRAMKQTSMSDDGVLFQTEKKINDQIKVTTAVI